MKRLGSLLMILIILSACNNDKPTPQFNVSHNIIPAEVIYMEEENVIQASKSTERTMSVRYHVQGKRVYVECYVPHFTFSNSQQGKKDGEGYLLVTIDGKKKKKVNSAAFIIDGLAKGKHVIQLELMHHDHSSYHLEKQLTIHI